MIVCDFSKDFLLGFLKIFWKFEEIWYFAVREVILGKIRIEGANL